MSPTGDTRQSEAGFGLIEVLVSALLVVVISLAVLGSMDSASRASGTSKAKAVAANVAQQDQERLRSLRPSELAGLTRTYTVEVPQGNAKVGYTVKSEGQYVLSPATNTGCTSGRRDEYLKIVSTVSWPEMRGVRPVRVESLVAPPLEAASPGQGSAVLKITRADGYTPVSGIPVTLAGPTAGMQPTGPEGCAMFADYPVGSYAFEFSQAGWVNPDGEQSVRLPVPSIVDQEVTGVDTLYDQPGRLEARFFTIAPSGNRVNPGTVARRPARSTQLTVFNSGVRSNGGARRFNTTEAPYPGGGTTDVATAPALFPFTSAYSVYGSGYCGQALPDSLAAQVNALGTGATATLNVSANGSFTDRWVLMPALDPTVRYQSGNGNGANSYQPVGGARVLIKSTNPACPTALAAQVTDSSSATLGTIPVRDFPYSGSLHPYSVCAEYQVSGAWRTSGWQSRENNQLNGTSWYLDIPNTSTGRCT